ncbi:MAG: ABC transporter ATP-binding protein [SAR202 cluster bacterium]|nr:ABC transporter ATP-binding protein [SAR202 cluster bacterium]
MTTPLLQVKDLLLHYRSASGVVQAVDGVSFSMERGQALGLVGESGAGKSSLGLALMRVLPRNVARFDGQVLLDGVDSLSLSDDAFRRQVRWKKIAMVFQGAMDSFNPVARVGQQVAEPLLLNGDMSKDTARDEALRLLNLVGLPAETYQRYPHELSGGMKQRALIVMALSLNPALAILDEPTSALDTSVQAQIMNLLKDLKRKSGLSYIFITHDIALASDLCDSVAVMYAGQIVEIGPVEQMLSRPNHPYTQKLLASIPRLDQESLPDFIPGAPPDMTAPPAGCRFHPRCPLRFDRCIMEAPGLLAVASDHQSRCWLVDKKS